VRFGYLGSLEVLDGDGAPVELGGLQARTVLAALLVAEGRVVPADALIDIIWGDSPPDAAATTIQSYVSRLRRSLGARRDAGDPVKPLPYEAGGYRIDLSAATVDARGFESLADQGRALLHDGRAEEARSCLVEADSLWRGPALLEFRHLDFATGVATRLEERRLVAVEHRIEADLGLGRHAVVAPELAELVAAHPLREALRAQLALALYRSGRQADALRSLAEARRTLADELGLDPGPELRELEQRILEHDPDLEAPRLPATAAAPAVQPGDGPAVEHGPGGLFGRDAELGELVAALDESGRDARFVVLEGEPGIGKTRLAEELRQRAAAAGALAVWGRADEGGAAPALWPWLAPLHEIAGRAGEAAAPVRDLLAGEAAPAEAGAMGTSQFDRFEAIAGVIDGVAADGPVVLLLDDLQWADTTSCELLAFLTGRLPAGVLVLVTVRRLEVGRRDAVTDALATVARRAGSRRIALRGLDAGSIRDVIGAGTGAEVSTDLVTTIHERAEGNPFFALELARLIGEGDPTGVVPSSVGDVIRRRLGHLPAETVELLGVAAVTGRDFELGLVTRASGIGADATLDALEPAVVHRLVVDVPDRPSVFSFAHALVREVVLDDLTALRRARLHLRVADAMEEHGIGVDDAEILAEHLWRAALVGGGRRAAEALERAAEVAVGRVAYDSAERLLGRAVHLRRTNATERSDEEAELEAICRLVEVARAQRYYTAAVDLQVMDRAKELAERLGRVDRVLDLVWVEWSAAATSCNLDLGRRLALAFRELADRSDDPEVVGRGLNVWAVHLWQTGHVGEAARDIRRAQELSSNVAGATFDLQTEAHLLRRMFEYVICGSAGVMSADEAVAGLEAIAETQADPFAVASAHGFAGSVALLLGEWKEMEAIVERGLRVDPGAAFVFWNGQHLMRRGVLAAWRGDIEEGLEQFAEGRALYTGVNGRASLAAMEASVAIGAARAGRLDDAERIAQSARTELEQYGERYNEPYILLAEAAILHGRGNADAATERATRAVAAAGEQGADGIARWIAQLATETGIDAN
jgi:DNA-binding SARP family transcriptional activator